LISGLNHSPGDRESRDCGLNDHRKPSIPHHAHARVIPEPGKGKTRKPQSLSLKEDKTMTDKSVSSAKPPANIIKYYFLSFKIQMARIKSFEQESDENKTRNLI
jgi:hypothetical protein